jgi:hypothetical protein
MHLDIHLSRYIVKAMYLEKPKRLIIWNGGSIIAGLSAYQQYIELGAHSSEDLSN